MPRRKKIIKRAPKVVKTKKEITEAINTQSNIGEDKPGIVS